MPEKFSFFQKSMKAQNQFIMERPRIGYLLEKALKSLVLLIVAGEGYGKTFEISYFLHKKRKNVIWISLTERDNDPWHFWETVVNAVSLCNANAGKILRETGFPETQNQMSRCLSVFSGQIFNRKKYVIVVDNCHFVHDKSVINFGNQFLSFPIPGETVIIISRTEPELNTMFFLSKGFLSRINAKDLSFNEEEIAEYFCEKNVNLSSGECRKIFDDTEGWILAVSTIAEEMKYDNKNYCRSFLESGNIRNMQESLFDSAPVLVKRFLIIISLFEQWPIKPLEAIAVMLSEKISPKPFSIERFSKRLIPLSSFIYYDIYIHGFRIHRAFLDFLRGKQKELSRREICSAAIIFAGWCRKNYLLIDAAANYGMAGDYKNLLLTIYSFPRLIPQSLAASIFTILDRVINDSERNENDECFLFLRHVTIGGILLNLGRYEESYINLKKSIEHFEPLLPCPGNCWILSACYNSLAYLSIINYRKTGDISLTFEYFKRGHYYYKQYPFPTSGPTTKLSAGSYAICIGRLFEKGEFEHFVEITAQCVPCASESNGGFLSGMDSLCRAELAFFKGDLDTAEKEARKTVFKAREKSQYETESKAFFYLLRIHLSNGDVFAFDEAWEQIENQLSVSNYINRYAIYDITAGWFYACIGELEMIPSWIVDENQESGLHLRYHNFETMIKARSLFAENRYEEVLEFLGKKETKNGIGSFCLGLLEISVLESAALVRIGNNDGAVKALERSFEIAVSNFDYSDKMQTNIESAMQITAFNMPFIELGKDMRRLASLAMKSQKCNIPKPWIKTMREKASVYEKKLALIREWHKNRQGKTETPLFTVNELSVLAGISKGFTRKEIAKENSLPVNTVKNIAKNIYTKLGAFNRADAVRIAAKSGLLLP